MLMNLTWWAALW